MFNSRRIYFVAVILLPIFSLVYMATIFGNGQVENIPIGIVDYTNSAITREIIRDVDAVPTFTVKPEHHYLSERQAREALKKMEIFGYLVIPPEFDKKLYNAEKPNLTYYFHYALIAIGGEVEGAFMNVLSSVCANFVKEAGIENGLSKPQVEAVVLPTSITNFPIYNSDLDFSIYISYPFFFIFFQILILVFIVYNIGLEIKEGTAKEWMATAGDNIYIGVFGKLFPYLIIFIVECLFANYVFLEWMRIPFSCSILSIIASSLVLVLSTMALGVILIALIPQLPIAISMASMIGALGATTSGVTFPVDQMYPIFEYLCYLFPIRYFIRLNHYLFYENVGFGLSWLYFAALIVFILLSLLTLRNLYKHLYTKQISSYWGVIIIVIGGTLGYGFLYNLLYKPNLVQQVPIAIVDNCQSNMSRKYIEYLNATQGIKVEYTDVNFQEGKKMMKEHKIRAMVYLPYNFDKNVFEGKESVSLAYETTTAFLYYLTIQSAATGAMQRLNQEYLPDIIYTLPLASKLAIAQAPRATFNGVPLYNTNGGYGSFLIPIVAVLALFQTMLMAMGSVLGNINQKLKLINKKIKLSTIFAIAGGFTIVYSLLSCFLVGVVPGLFNLPDIGDPLLIFPFIILFLVTSTIFLSAFYYIFSDSEVVMILVPFFSIGLIFLSGMSFPMTQIPKFWQLVYYLFPSSAGITGFVKINSMGGNIGSITPEIIMLLGQLTFYLVILLTAYYFINRKKAGTING